MLMVKEYVPALPTLVLTFKENVRFSTSDWGGIVTATQTWSCPTLSSTLYDDSSNPTTTSVRKIIKFDMLTD